MYSWCILGAFLMHTWCTVGAFLEHCALLAHSSGTVGALWSAYGSMGGVEGMGVCARADSHRSGGDLSRLGEGWAWTCCRGALPSCSLQAIEGILRCAMLSMNDFAAQDC